ncbi:MAG: amidohydrolase family protein [Rectinemataceae bacterium]
MVDYCIRDATIVTVNPQREVIDRGYVMVHEGRIAEIGMGPCPEKLQKSIQVIAAEGKIVFPGLINTHNHLFQTLTKGLGDDMVLSNWLSSMTFPCAQHLMEEDVYAAAMHGCIEGIRSGTTTMVDYMYPHPRPGLSDAVIRAFMDLKIRGVLARGMMNTGERFGTPHGIMQDVGTVERDIVRLFDAYHNGEEGRIKIWVAPAAVWSNTKEMLQMVWEISRSYSSGFSIHISETPFDREAALQQHGRSDAEMLECLGIVGTNVLMVHCVYLTERDIRMARYYGMNVSHNAVSNMYLSSGVAPVPEMIEKGIVVGLGTDGPASNNSQDMLELLKFTALLHKVHAKDPTIITAEKVLEMATIDGARSIGMDHEVGSLEAGKKADLFIYDPMKSPKSIPMHNPVSTLVYAGSCSCIDTVMIDGNPVLLEGNITTADEISVMRTCQKRADELVARAGIVKKGRRWRSQAF